MFDLSQYETVAARLEKFWKDYPDARVETELIHYSPTEFIFKAYLYKTYLDAIPFSTGYARELVTAKGVNSDSALENCETSAIGRALANGNLTSQAKGLANGKRPSREEMTKVAAAENNAQAALINPDPWNEAVKPNPEPTTIAEGVSIIADILGGAPVEQPDHEITCAHGKRKFVEGVKNGKPWAGYMCSGMSQAFGDTKCDPIWAVLKDGVWTPRTPKE